MHIRTIVIPTLVALTAAPAVADWPEFRGPTVNGVYPGPLPTNWGPTINIAWKAEVPGQGWSSPVIAGGKVYLTTAVKDGDALSLKVLALDAANGTELWDTEVFRLAGGKLPRTHAKNSHASGTPVVSGGKVYAHFGHFGTACLNPDGEVVWKFDDLPYEPVHGNGGSPVVAGGKVFFSIDGADKQLMVARDAATGAIKWKVDRNTDADRKFSFGTPLLIEVNGKSQLVSQASGAVLAYDPETGHEIWRVRYGSGYSVVPRPVFGHGLLFVCTGFDRPKLLAIRPDGTGDVTATHIAWTCDRAMPNTPSPALAGDELYTVSDGGVATCLDAKTGKVHWSERIGGGHSASPLVAGRKVYFLSEDGVGVVVAADKKFKQLAKNPMSEKSLASYAADGGALFLRTEKHLYRIEGK